MSNDNQHSNPNHVAIIVNGTEETVPKGDITFDQVVALGIATGLPTGPNILYTITYRKADGSKTEGTLVAGQRVSVKEGTIFNVSPSDKS